MAAYVRLAPTLDELPPPQQHGGVAGAEGAIREAFNAGCASFEAAGYRFGDPQEYLHPPGHPHWARPDFANCRSCTPPVQGKVRGAWSEWPPL